jgi:Flp pilus assembly protein TadG
LGIADQQTFIKERIKLMKAFFRTQKFRGLRAQAIVEFALVLPILMMMLVGILEVGRMLYTYAAVNNASREAARYGSALGRDSAYTGDPYKYKNCEGIRDSANRSAYFTPLTITIAYDTGPGSSSTVNCTALTGEDGAVAVSSGDRVLVTVSATYSPLVTLVPLGNHTFTSSSARTILGFIEVGSNPGPTATSPSTPATAVPSSTPTSTVIVASHTPTATFSGPFVTFTPLPTNTPTVTPSISPTPTVTFTPTLTFTPTSTPTAMPGCGNITTGPIVAHNGSNIMSMTITNPHEAITVSSVQVFWNATTGSPSGGQLTLKSASLGTTFWNGPDNTSGNLTIPTTSVIIPGNNATSTISFTFDKNYKNPLTFNKIIITLSTPGCETYTITKP